MAKKTKEKRIEEELTRITARFSRADGNQKAIVTPLLQNAAFMKVTLEDLQEIINAEGVVDEYKNGQNQYGMKQSATLQSYNALIKNYASVIKTLAQILPPEEKQQPKAKTPAEIIAEKEAEAERFRKWADVTAEQFGRVRKGLPRLTKEEAKEILLQNGNDDAEADALIAEYW